MISNFIQDFWETLVRVITSLFNPNFARIKYTYACKYCGRWKSIEDIENCQYCGAPHSWYLIKNTCI